MSFVFVVRMPSGGLNPGEKAGLEIVELSTGTCTTVAPRRYVGAKAKSNGQPKHESTGCNQ